MNRVGSLYRLAGVVALLHCFIGGVGNAQSLSSIKIGDSESQLETLGTPAVSKQRMGPHTAVKFELPDGNSLSATFRNSDGVIVFLESDWGGQQSGSFSDFRNFKFGSTSLDEIRAELGHNGMSFLNGPNTTLTETGDLVTFNTYELSRSDVAVTLITKIAASRLKVLRDRYGDEKAATLIGQEAKLDSIIIADMNYLTGIWGKELVRDKNYRRIQWTHEVTSSVSSEKIPPLIKLIALTMEAECGKVDVSNGNFERVITVLKSSRQKPIYILDASEKSCGYQNCGPNGCQIHVFRSDQNDMVELFQGLALSWKSSDDRSTVYLRVEGSSCGDSDATCEISLDLSSGNKKVVRP